MKILLLGKNGQLGWELSRTLLPLGEVIALGRDELDLTDYKAIDQKIKLTNPQIIINAAAYTAVDKAEEEQDLAMAVNGTAPGIIAEAADRVGASLIHYSTDYVFDGQKNKPYTEEDEPSPINIYGKTKLAGEKAVQQVGLPHLIFRTSWVYSLRGRNFLLTMIRLFKEREEIHVVNDQYGSPSWSRMIAEATSCILAKYSDRIQDIEGIYNLSNQGETSWYSFAKKIHSEIFKHESSLTKLSPITTSQYKTSAKRPLYSVLSTLKISKEMGIFLPSWDSCLSVVLNDYYSYKN